MTLLLRNLALFRQFWQIIGDNLLGARNGVPYIHLTLLAGRLGISPFLQMDALKTCHVSCGRKCSRTGCGIHILFHIFSATRNGKVAREYMYAEVSTQLVARQALCSHRRSGRRGNWPWCCTAGGRRSGLQRCSESQHSGHYRRDLSECRHRCCGDDAGWVAGLGPESLGNQQLVPLCQQRSQSE